MLKTAKDGLRPWGWLAAFLAAAAAVRFAGIMWGLPNTFNADEPHLVNLAVSFGGGSLKPYAFKFPSLWPYILFFFYGLYFLVWSGFGLLHGVGEFIGLYARDITWFYLIGRWLSALCQLGGLAVIWSLERKRREQGHWPWAALLLAFAPVLVDTAHSCKPDSLMFIFICLAWKFALEAREEGRRSSYLACGAALGFALSSHFMALGALSILPLAHLFRAGPRRQRYFLEGAGLAAAAFFAGSPYVLLDFQNFRFWFWDGIVKSSHTVAAWHQAGFFNKTGTIFSNAITFTGSGLSAFHPTFKAEGSFYSSGYFAAAPMILGIVQIFRRNWKLAAFLLGPFFVYFALLINNLDATVLRYLSCCFPGLALLISEGIRALDFPKFTWRRLAFISLFLGPGIWCCVKLDYAMRLPDTRDASREWVLSNVPTGAVILTELPHASPRLDITKEQAEQLYERTRANGSPRARLYKGMADTHPGGGYRIYRIKYSEVEAAGYAKHIEVTQADWPLCDVSQGLAEARALGVRYVITSSYGSSLEFAPEKSKFFQELERNGTLLKTFSPERWILAGPVIRVFELRRKRF